MLEKLKLLLILLAIGGTTPLYAQQDSNSICLTNKQFDFYAKSLIERNGLAADTTILCTQTRHLSNIITNMDKQMDAMGDISLSKDAIIKIKNKDYEVLSKDFLKQQKKVKRYKQSTLVFMATTLVLGLIVLVK